MTTDAPRGLLRAFAQLEDPRMDRTRKHSLSDLLTLATCAVIWTIPMAPPMERAGKSPVRSSLRMTKSWAIMPRR